MFNLISAKVVRFILTLILLTLLSGKPTFSPTYVDCVPVDGGNCPTSGEVVQTFTFTI